jgi:hypothetical protein
VWFDALAIDADLGFGIRAGDSGARIGDTATIHADATIATCALLAGIGYAETSLFFANLPGPTRSIRAAVNFTHTVFAILIGSAFDPGTGLDTRTIAAKFIGSTCDLCTWIGDTFALGVADLSSGAAFAGQPTTSAHTLARGR